MVSCILVTLDGSERAEQSAPVAVHNPALARHKSGSERKNQFGLPTRSVGPGHQRTEVVFRQRSSNRHARAESRRTEK